MRITLKQHPSRRRIFASRDGRVFIEATASRSSGGYRTIKLGKETIRRHTLVIEAWRGPRPRGQGVRHKDGDPTNDRAFNLIWGTQKQNAQDTVRHGRSTRGERNAHAKLTKAQVIAIRRRRKAGETGKGLAMEFGVSQANICDIIKRRTWRWLK
jgi:hypothetical protein